MPTTPGGPRLPSLAVSDLRRSEAQCANVGRALDIAKTEEAAYHVDIVRVSSPCSGVHAGVGARRRIRADRPRAHARERTQAPDRRCCSRRLSHSVADYWSAARVLFRKGLSLLFLE